MKSFFSSKVCLVVAGVSGMVSGPAAASDLERGKALHDTFCVMCHAPAIYSRSDRLANTYLEVRQQVERWQGNARLRWTQSDIESVTDYVADQYYKIPR